MAEHDPSNYDALLTQQFQTEQAAVEAEQRAAWQEGQRTIAWWHEHYGPQEPELAISQAMKELWRRRETGELSQEDYPLTDYYELQKSEKPLTREELRNRALVIHIEELEGLHSVEFILPDDELMVLEADDLGRSGYGRQPVIMFPEEFGNPST